MWLYDDVLYPLLDRLLAGLVDRLPVLTFWAGDTP